MDKKDSLRLLIKKNCVREIDTHDNSEVEYIQIQFETRVFYISKKNLINCLQYFYNIETDDLKATTYHIDELEEFLVKFNHKKITTIISLNWFRNQF